VTGGELHAATPAEVAEQLRTTERWVREQCNRRRVPHLRMGRRVALLPEHVAALARLVEVEAAVARPLPDKALAALGATSRSRAAHRSRRVKGPETDRPVLPPGRGPVAPQTSGQPGRVSRRSSAA
jgi:hypothetical protein